jgi:hypothetical protein
MNAVVELFARLTGRAVDRGEVQLADLVAVIEDVGCPLCVSAEAKCASKPWEVDDGLWARLEPLLPVVQRRYRHPGRRRLDDRQVLSGILFVLYTGIP